MILSTAVLEYLFSILIMRQVKPYISNKTVKKEYRLFFREKHDILKHIMFSRRVRHLLTFLLLDTNKEVEIKTKVGVFFTAQQL